MSNFDIYTATLQEAVDYAVQQIVKQGGQCVSSRGCCIYDDGQGKHCALGWLVPPESVDLVGCDESSDALLAKYGDTLAAVVVGNKVVIDALQEFHDYDSNRSRCTTMENLEQMGINTDGKWWDKWIEMGTEQQGRMV